MKQLVPLTVLLVTSCTPDPDMSLGVEPPTQTNSRVTVTRVGVFLDSLAYSGKRGIYVIRDNKTGQEYIGVSSIGISETGSHQSGKTRIQDER